MKKVKLPRVIKRALEKGAHLVLSVSGGKDSQVMSRALVDLHRARGYCGRLIMVHADLGAMERTETRPFIEQEAAALGVELVVLDEMCLLEHIERRYERLTAQGRVDVVPFPDAKNRYCTSDLKRNQIDKWIRRTFAENETVICAIGIRASESSARAKKPVYRLRANCQAKSKGRTVYDWHAIHNWQLHEVWLGLGYSLEALADIQARCKSLIAQNLNPYAYLYNIGFAAHVAYALGNERLSCAMCILGCKGDLLNGAHNRPDTLRRLVDLEIKSGKSFRSNLWLASLAPRLLRPDQITALNQKDLLILNRE